MHYLTHPTQKVFEAKYSDPMNQMPFARLLEILKAQLDLAVIVQHILEGITFLKLSSASH